MVLWPSFCSSSRGASPSRASISACTFQGMSLRGHSSVPPSDFLGRACTSEGNSHQEPMLRACERVDVSLKRIRELEGPGEDEARGGHGGEPLVGLVRLNSDELIARQAVDGCAAGRHRSRAKRRLGEAIDHPGDPETQHEVAGEGTLEEEEAVRLV